MLPWLAALERLKLVRRTAPSDTTNKLYNVGGTLYWAGSAVAVGATMPTGTEGQTLYNNAGTWTAHSGVFWDDTNNRLGVGVVAPSAKLGVLATTEQLRLSYNAANYTKFTVASTGNPTIATSLGPAGAITFETPITINPLNPTGGVNAITVTSNWTPGANTFSAFNLTTALLGSGSPVSLTGNNIIPMLTIFSGTLGSLKGINIAPIIGGGTITESIAIHYAPIKYGGVLVNSYGIKLENIPVGSTLTYAIHTGTGLNSFGDSVGIGARAFGTNAQYNLGIINGTAPSTFPADMFQMYSADQAAGNACPHIYTENGALIKLFQGAALTTQSTTITHTAPGTPDYAIQDLTNSSPYGFVSKDEGNTVLAVIANLQARVAELEARLKAQGLLA